MTPEEFRKVILPEGQRLYALAYRFLNNREEAEDTVQEVMMKLWEERTRLGDYANPAAWATTVTRNMCIDLLRKRRKMTHEEIDSVWVTGNADEGAVSASDSREAAMLITQIAERMKEPYRSAVILRDMEGYSYEEAAVVMKTSVETLRTILSRARKSIREELEKIYSYGTGRDKGTA
ncbi:MAG: RNA polymerase sigma factor [Bacteroidales bacterium]|jgi:RNA polymerase sigma-70 factor (ECF subfamily)|nr:RNA polymerase sigma factor [Bacteroidales bacterium]